MVIAGALVMDPELVVADEPVSMLDVSIRTELLRLMLDLRRARGLTYLFITHDLSLAWVHRRPDRRHVPRQDHGDRAGGAGHPLAAPPVHAGAGLRVARHRSRPAPGERAKRTILVGETPDAAHIPPGCRFRTRCPLAFDRCRIEEPPLIDVGDGHAAACWLAQAGPRDLPVIDAVQAGQRATAAEIGVATRGRRLRGDRRASGRRASSSGELEPDCAVGAVQVPSAASSGTRLEAERAVGEQHGSASGWMRWDRRGGHAASSGRRAT